MLGFYKLSLIGTSHLAQAHGVCQDASDAKVLPNGWVIAAVADGLGNARHSDEGAKWVVHELMSFVEAYLPDRWHPATLTALLHTAYQAAWKKVKEVATDANHEIYDYDTTLTCALFNGVDAVYGHVGDGGIVALSAEGDFTLITKAQKGEEFNEVIPLRAGPTYWVFGEIKDSTASLLIMTDGVYDIACPWLIAKSKQPVYVNYVRPFIDESILNVKTQEDFLQLQKEVEEFLNSELSMQITDDKTVVCVLNTDTLPKTKPEDYYAEPKWELLAKQHHDKLYGKPLDTCEDSGVAENDAVPPTTAPTATGDPVRDKAMEDMQSAGKTPGATEMVHVSAMQATDLYRKAQQRSNEKSDKGFPPNRKSFFFGLFSGRK